MNKYNDNLNELVQLDELRQLLRSISVTIQSVGVTVDLLRSRVDETYYSVCRSFNEDGTMNKEAAAILQRNKIPHSMQMSIPDKGYAMIDIGDLVATTLV